MAMIQLISGPRNISTALMYSFASRADCDVVDEPYYAYYLHHTGIVHPGREEILEAQPTDADEVYRGLTELDRNDGYLLIKNMAHHIDGYDYTYSHDIRNIFLIRDPKRLVASFAKVMPDMTPADTGLEREAKLYQEITQGTDARCAVIDSGLLLQDPASYLAAVCAAIDIPYDPAMLNWPPGPHARDGVWAKYWYANVHRSTGFGSPPQGQVELSPNLMKVYEQILPHYQYLYQQAIKI